MKDFLNNSIIPGIIAIVIGIIISGILGWLKFRKDERIVTSFLKNSGIDTEDTFKTTHSISSATRLSRERIIKVCSKSSKVKRSDKDRDSWKLR